MPVIEETTHHGQYVNRRTVVLPDLSTDEVARMMRESPYGYRAADAPASVARALEANGRAEHGWATWVMRDTRPQGSATAGNNRAVHVIAYAMPDHYVTMCGQHTPKRPQATQDQLPKCERCF